MSFPEKEVHIHDKPWAASGHGNKREHNVVSSLYLEASILEKKVQERYRRYAQIEAIESRAELYLTEDAEIVLAAYGASARIARSAIDNARAIGIKAGLIRPITLWPFPKKEFLAIAETAKDILVVEMNMGQMVDDARILVERRVPVHFYGRTGGMVPTPTEVLNEIKKLSGGEN